MNCFVVDTMNYDEGNNSRIANKCAVSIFYFQNSFNSLHESVLLFRHSQGADTKISLKRAEIKAVTINISMSSDMWLTVHRNSVWIRKTN